MSSRKPVIGVVSDMRILDPHDFYMVGGKYLRSVITALDAIPLIIPALGDEYPLADALSVVDGILLPGAYANVAPERYGKTLEDPDSILDKARDATSLPLIKMAVERDIPILGICRGFQEINVAYGGTLHQLVHLQPGLNDHREDKSLPLEGQYADAHVINLAEGGWLREAYGQDQAMVNSIHQQGVNRLADDLIVEATAEDGLVEAFRLNDDNRFLLAAQWHPEWQVMDNPFNLGIYQLFSKAVRERMS